MPTGILIFAITNLYKSPFFPFCTPLLHLVVYTINISFTLNSQRCTRRPFFRSKIIFAILYLEGWCVYICVCVCVYFPKNTTFSCRQRSLRTKAVCICVLSVCVFVYARKGDGDSKFSLNRVKDLISSLDSNTVISTLVKVYVVFRTMYAAIFW